MECPVCFEIFRNPLLLPGCGHTVCQACAELLVTDGNFLRCPECRLIYQLRRGIKSLPKNVALQRTIEEHSKASSASTMMCESHPQDAISLYCKTCEKGICLKCYFPNTLRKGDTLHSGHQVDTSEDVFSRERRLLEEKCRECEGRHKAEIEYIEQLENSVKKLKTVQEQKLLAIDQNKNELIAAVKQTAAKLKFTLNGSIVWDMECLKTSLQSAKDQLAMLKDGLMEAVSALNKVSNESPEIRLVKSARKKLEDILNIRDPTQPIASCFSKIENFDTSIQSCLNDTKRALSYQTECPRTPSLSKDDCIISDVVAYIPVHYNESVRTKKLVLFFKETMYKGLSEKDWDRVEVEDLRQGSGIVLLTGLKRGTMYKAYAVASNDFGESPASDELWFRTVDCEIDSRIISR